MYLGLDLGTSGLKGVLIDDAQRLVAEATADYLVRRPEMLGAGTGSRYLTTGKPESVSAHATQFLRRGVRFEGA